MAYHAFKDANGNEHGSFEVFYDDDDNARNFDGDGEPVQAGWYWWACFPGCIPDGCFPGCIPDGEPSGPFASEQEAIDDARSK